jgi:transposase
MMPPDEELGSMDREAVIEKLREVCREAVETVAEVARLQRRIAGLEEELRQSKKSAAPFSKNRPKAHPKAPGRKAGQGVFTRREAPVVEPQDEVRELAVPLASARCPNCDSPLEVRTETASVVDAPAAPRRVITKFAVEVGHCPRCHTEVRGTHPELPPDQQGATAHRVGAQCRARGLALHYGLGVPQRKVPLILQNLTGIRLTQSALTQSALRLCQNGAPAQRAYSALRREIRRAAVVNTDDTGWKIGGQPAYLMGFFSQRLAVYQIRRRHRHDEVREMLGVDFGGLLGTDRGPSCDAGALDEIPMQKCLSHLLKNISQAEEGKTGEALRFMQRLKALLREGIGLWHELRGGALSPGDYQRRGAALRERLKEHLHPRQFRDADAQRLLDGIGQRHDHGQVLLFLERPEIEPTNNRAERGLRGAVIARKVSQCSKNAAGADCYAIFKSITETIKLRGENLLAGLAKLLQPQLQRAEGR